MELARRTLLKAVIWQVIGFATMVVVGLLATGSLATGGGIAAVNTVLGLTLYVGYERLWNRIAWGRNV